MPTTPITDLLKAQATVAHNLFVDLTRLHADLQLNAGPDILENLDAVTHNANYLLKNLSLINHALTPPDPKRPTNKRDCPDQLPLWPHLPADSER